jgi:serine/threonine protein kinase
VLVAHVCRWHADIKPDNILLVHGEFKLADFGFAKFAEIVENDKPPEQPIMGGTDTYGNKFVLRFLSLVG